MAARITRSAAAPAYHPPLHEGVDAVRLQGLEAGPTQRFWVGRSSYAPGGFADTSRVATETVYVVLDGGLRLTVDGEVQDLAAGDSVHFEPGTERRIENASDAPAELLVVIGTPS